MASRLLVVLGDVEGSRRIEDKESFKERMDSTLAMINDEHRNDLVAEFKRIKGIDEVGGVLRRIDGLYDVVTTLYDGVRPERIRLAVVYDVVDVSLETGDVASMDGTAFHKAAECMDGLERDGLFFRIDALQPLLDKCVSGYVNLLYLYKMRWSDRQFETVSMYRTTRNQADVAEQLGVSQQSVSNVLRRSRWSEMNLLENQLKEVLQGYRQGPGRERP